MIAAPVSGLTQIRAIARLHNPACLRGFTFQDSAGVLVPLLDTGHCDDGAGSPRRIVVRHAGQIDLAEHSERQLKEAA